MAVEFLHELDVPFFKVGSGDTNNFPYLEKTAKKGKHFLLSHHGKHHSVSADQLLDPQTDFRKKSEVSLEENHSQSWKKTGLPSFLF